MTIALVASASKQNGTSTAINTVGANLIVLFTEDFTSGGTAPTDSVSNTWTKIASNGSGAFGAMWKCFNPITSTSHTFTPHGSFPSISVIVLSGAGDLDTGGTGVSFNSSTTGGAATLQTGSVTPSVNGSIVIFGCGDAWALPITTNVGSFIPAGALGLVGGTSFANGLAYEIQTTATARNPTFSFASNRANAVIAVFKPGIPPIPPQDIKIVGVAPPFFMGDKFLQQPSYFTTDTAYSATSLRVSSFFRETLMDGPGTVRVAMFIREVLRSARATPNFVTQSLGPPFHPPFAPNFGVSPFASYPKAPVVLSGALFPWTVM